MLKKSISKMSKMDINMSINMAKNFALSVNDAAFDKTEMVLEDVVDVAEQWQDKGEEVLLNGLEKVSNTQEQLFDRLEGAKELLFGEARKFIPFLNKN